jgi:hypothetical protein
VSNVVAGAFNAVDVMIMTRRWDAGHDHKKRSAKAMILPIV